MRNLTFSDRLVGHFDNSLRTLFGNVAAKRPNPATTLEEHEYSESERQHTAGLMRINHTGEICAQALYQGQALTAKSAEVQHNMQQASDEENDHLEWTHTRLKELQSEPSLLNPLWYAGAFTMGAVAGLAGDKWSLGFVAETEKQVVQHLEDHLSKLPPNDAKSKAILEQMKTDEAKHATQAIDSGGAELPIPVKMAMKLCSQVMKTFVYRV